MSVSKPVADVPETQPVRRIAGISVASVAFSFAKKISTVAIVYLLGYLDFSVAWLVGPVIYSVIREEWRKEKELKRNVAKAAAMCSEKDIILARVDDLPSWVFFPDVERAEWLNRILRQVWPNVNNYAKALIKESIEPAIAESLAAYKLSGFQFHRMLLGSIPPRIGGVKVYDKNVSRNEILMDIDLFYAGDCDISFTLGGVSGGIKDFQIHGMVRVIMKPLISVIPMVGGLQVFFLNNPIIDFNLVGVADILDMPGLSDLLRRIIVEQVANMMVLPNKLPIQLSDVVPQQLLKTPEPEGVLRVHVVEAKKLMKKDIGVLGKGKSDPYAIINVGAQEFRTSIITNSVDPKWDFWCEFKVDYRRGMHVTVRLFDFDHTRKDESLGRATVEINHVAKKGEVDTWITLEEAKHGMVHLRMSWLNLSSSPTDLKSALAETQHLRVTTMSSALLTVFIDSIKNLIPPDTPTKLDPYVSVSIGKTTKQTAVQRRTGNPVYEEGFVFLVPNPEVDTLHFKVTDNKTTKDIAEFVYNVGQLLDKEDMSVESQPYQLKMLGSDGKISLSMKLRILTCDRTASIDEGEFNDVPSTLPRQSSLPDKSPPSTPVKRQPSISDSIKSLPIESTHAPTSDKSINSTTASISNSPRPLHKTGSVVSVSSSSRGEFNLGKILLGFAYSDKRQRFEVIVHKIQNLPCPDPSNIPDPYVKLYLLPERSRDSKRRTESMRDNCNPEYNQTFEYIISLAELSSRQLEISVCTRKGIFASQSSCMGQILINLGEIDVQSGTTEWFDLQPEFHKDKDD